MLRPDLAPFLAARTSAVVGASERGAALDLLTGLRRGGGAVVGVNPRRSEVGGVPCVPSLADVDEVPELVAVAVGAAGIVAAVGAALEAGARHFVVPGLGLEDGAAGAAARAELTRLVDASGAAMVGPNCMGVATARGPSAWIGTLPGDLREGGVACIVQSGSIGEALLAMGPRVGLRCVVSTGSESVRDASDWVAYLAGDERTCAIGLFLETVRRPAEFAEALELAARAAKPVIALKVGRSAAGARRALAHTGAIVGSERAFAALCDAHGVVRCGDYADWLEQLEVFGSTRRPAGRRTVVISNSGGEAELLADLAEDAGLPLEALPADLAAALDAAFPFGGAQNPIDYWAVAPVEEIVPATVRMCAAHPAVDAVLLNVDQSLRFTNGEAENALAAARALVAAAEATGTFCALVSSATSDAAPAVLEAAAAGGVPVLQGAGAAVRAVAAAATWRPRLRPRPIAAGPALPAPELAGRSGALPERESKALLARYGVAGTREERASTPAAAAQAAARIGFPVVVKSDGPAHKERAGGVVLGLMSREAVERAAERLGPVLVAEELRGGVEVLCGLVRDPDHGPIVVCGVGGAWAEQLAGHARAALAPLSHDAACALVREVVPLRGRLGEGDCDAVAGVVCALARAAADHPCICEIDVNPVRVAAGQAVALDALVVVAEAQ